MVACTRPWKTQAKELRGKIEEAERVLKGVMDTAYVLPTPPELGKE